MNVALCELAGLLVIDPAVFGDERGFFMESWNRRKYQESGVDAEFVQDNFSASRRGTLRGLHFQNPGPQAKLVSVLQGEVFDVVVDLRRRSSTFGHWLGIRLSADNRRQLFIPAGFAHGFLVLSETALFHYKCSDFYAPGHEWAIRWNDPEIGVEWPLEAPTLSPRDANAPWLREIPREQLFD